MSEPKTSSSQQVFIHAQFRVPDSAASGENKTVKIVQQHFDSTNCEPAIIGLRGEPVKPKPGDYAYSGMHDHGPLPKPKEGGVFASLIAFCQEAKKSSDSYLTEVIEKENDPH